LVDCFTDIILVLHLHFSHDKSVLSFQVEKLVRELK
jgi:hypothetical protein